MIGPLEAAILLLIILIVFSGRIAKHLPALGRSAGEGTKKARAMADDAKDSAKTAYDDKVAGRLDPERLGRAAGQGIREAREVKGSLEKDLGRSSGSEKEDSKS